MLKSAFKNISHVYVLWMNHIVSFLTVALQDIPNGTIIMSNTLSYSFSDSVKAEHKRIVINEVFIKLHIQTDSCFAGGGSVIMVHNFYTPFMVVHCQSSENNTSCKVEIFYVKRCYKSDL